MTTFSRAAVELPVTADREDGAPLTTQIAAQLREALADGRLAPGERLPSSRALAATLGVSRTVVTAAYTQLFAEGWLEGRHGSGTYVAAGAGSPSGAAADAPAGFAAVPPPAAAPAGAAESLPPGTPPPGTPRPGTPPLPAQPPVGPPGPRPGCHRSTCGPAFPGRTGSTRRPGAAPGGRLARSRRPGGLIPVACPRCARR